MATVLSGTPAAGIVLNVIVGLELASHERQPPNKRHTTRGDALFQLAKIFGCGLIDADLNKKNPVASIAGGPMRWKKLVLPLLGTSIPSIRIESLESLHSRAPTHTLQALVGLLDAMDAT
jgi:hypothetical protein